MAMIKKKGAKLKLNRKNTAIKKAKITQQLSTVLVYPSKQTNDPFEEERIKMIAATIAAKDA